MQTAAVARRLPPSVLPLAVGAAAAAGCAVVAMNDPSQSGIAVCSFRALTGLPCPGCGATRAAYQLMHGNLGAALHFNAVAVVIVFPLMIGAYLAWAIPRLRGPKLITFRMPNWCAWSLLGLLLVWWVVRMLPFAPFTSLRV